MTVDEFEAIFKTHPDWDTARSIADTVPSRVVTGIIIALLVYVAALTSILMFVWGMTIDAALTISALSGTVLGYVALYVLHRLYSRSPR
ncbi:MAG: hypothetical protein ABSE76_03490 [Minisyncoccia bacterium]